MKQPPEPRDVLVLSATRTAIGKYGGGLQDVPPCDLAATARSDQDALAVESHRRAAAAIEAGYFVSQIVPVDVQTRKGVVQVLTDEHVRSGVTVAELAKLRRTGGRYALMTLCIGGGQGIAATFERIG